MKKSLSKTSSNGITKTIIKFFTGEPRYKIFCDVNIDMTSIKQSLEQQVLDETLPRYQVQSLECLEDESHDSYKLLQSVQTNYILKMIEDILIFIRHLSRSKNVGDLTVAAITFAKLRIEGPLLVTAIDMWKKYFGVQLQDSENPFTQLRNLLDKYETVKSLPIFEKLYKFLTYCVCMNLFKKIGLNVDFKKYIYLEDQIIKQKKHMGPDFIHCMLDTALFLCETGYQCVKTGSLTPIYHSDKSYVKWLVKVEDLKVKATFITNPEPHGFTYHEFMCNLKDCIEFGDNMFRFLKEDKIGSSAIKKMLCELKMIQAQCLTKRLAQQDRKAPFGILVVGGSSVGKSTFTKMLYYHFGKMFKLPTDPEYRFVRNPFDEFWTNFNSSQWCVQLDDIAFIHPESSQGVDPSLAEMLQVVNNVPYVPAQADLCDKGRTPLKAEFVIATTNTQSLNAHRYFACPLAVLRRLPYVLCIKPKPEYTKDGCMLDSTNIPEIVEGEYPDYWIIEVQRVIPSTGITTHMGQMATYEKVAIFDNVYTFLSWFSDVAIKSRGIQDKSVKCDTIMSQISLCEKCFLPINKCACVRVQSLDSTIDNLENRYYDAIVTRYPDASPQFPNREIPGTVEWFYMEFWNTKPWEKFFILYYYLIFVLYGKNRWLDSFLKIICGSWVRLYVFFGLIHIPVIQKMTLVAAGKFAASSAKHPQVKYLVLSISIAYILYKLYGAYKWLMKPEDDGDCWLQGVSEERGEKPVSKGDKAENVWYKDAYECSKFDYTSSSLSKASMQIDEFTNLINRNLVAMQSRNKLDDGTVRCYKFKALCLGGRIYITNNHNLLADSFELEVVFQSSKDGVTENCKFLITPSQYMRIPEKDIILLELPVPPRKDIRDLFPKSSYSGVFDAVLLGRDMNGILNKNKILNLRKSTFSIETKLKVPIIADLWMGYPETMTQFGDCGSTLVSITPMGPVILGIHILATEGKVGSIRLDSEFIYSLPLAIMSETPPTLQVGEFKQELTDLNKKSPVRFVESGTLNVYGSFVGFRSAPKSLVTKTYISDEMVKRGYKLETGAPIMRGWEPWRKALLDMVRPVTHMDMTVLAICAEQFTKDILDRLKKSDLEELVVYDNKTAINGYPGLAYVDKLNRNTSAGFPFRCGKKHFLFAIPDEGEYTNSVDVSHEIKQEMDKIIHLYENGKLYNPVFTAALKDEPTTFKKIEASKTRVFCGAPLPWSLVVRKYLLSMIRVIQKNRFIFEAGPGTIAQSKEWDDIYQYLVTFGEHKIVAGDYGKFDKRMPAQVILLAFGIIRDILTKAGWSPRDLRVIQGIAEDTAFPMIDFNGDLIKCYGTNPSGHPLTVIINGLANSLYVRYCYYINNPHKECFTFKNNVHLMTYGDDMIMGVSDNCNFLNHTVMQKTLGEIDIEFTMADKEAQSVPFIHIKDATFLRRSWRYEPELNLHVCPIEHASIDKMLTMCVASKTISPQLQAIAIMHTAVREYFWYGKEIFLDKRKMFLEVIKDLNLEFYYEHEFPTWEILVDEFKLNSKLR